MVRTLLLLATALAAEATTTIMTASVFFPEKRTHPDPCLGSIVGVASDVTSIDIRCYLAGTSVTEFGVETWSIAQGPSTWAMSGNVATSSPDEMNCRLDAAKDVAHCQMFDRHSRFLESGTVTTTDVDGYKTSMWPVAITGGLEKLGAPTASATSDGASATTSSSASPTATSTTASTTASTTSASTMTASTMTTSTTSVSTVKTSTTSANTTATSPTAKVANAAGSLVTPFMLHAGLAVIVGGALVI
ncbi:hypothetical protein DCS_02091 [Drechmeria coniospora]|uniref:Uncharacterized protein n=1 Tax=Drechmeria coniospora TaxID=98403 RepID=A0A151GV54_DRECN|nr:hypothetical protein DCS_02091 [Drechmeria coniospora]KYK60951.1 hypothetical protein DCS_02091 [Drechmeria coniospora]